MEQKITIFAAFAAVAGLAVGLPSDPAAEIRSTRSSRVRGVRDNNDADIVLGGLFPIRSVKSGTIQCGEIRAERSVERMEAMLYALDAINNSTELLPGLKVGFDLRDTCSSETVGTEEALDIIMSGDVLKSVSVESDCPSSLITSNSTRNTPPSGVVGAASSGVSRSVASLLRLFSIPQISYSSTSTDLSDAERYDYFHRTISPDNLQTTAMVDFLLRMNWTYVITVHSDNTYGSSGINTFTVSAQKKQICIENSLVFSPTSPNDTYTRIARTLVYNATSNVIVLFTLDFFAQRLIEQVHTVLSRSDVRHKRRLIWIASDAWAESSVIQEKYSSTVAGYIGFLPFTKKDVGFRDYYSTLTPATNVRNRAIFTEYYNSVCSSCNGGPITSLPGYTQGTFIPLVIDAVYAFAYAVQLYLDIHCPSGNYSWDRLEQKCSGSNVSLSTTLLRDLLLHNVSFNSSTGFPVEFDQAGNVEIPCRLINFQARQNSEGGISYNQTNIGVWYPRRSGSSSLQVDFGKIQFGLQPGPDNVPQNEPVKSTCGEQCEEGQIRQYQSDGCCWICTACTGHNYSSSPNASQCSECPEGMWGNSPFEGSSSCAPIPERQLKPSDSIAIVAMVLSGLALIVVGVVVLIFVINYKHTVVKSSGREQVALLLIGITLSFCLSFIIVPPPSIPVCLFQRVLIWTSFSLIYGALLVKIIRVYRIFSHNLTSRPHFTKPYHQILFTLLIVLVQLIITLASLISAPPRRRQMLSKINAASLSTPTLVIACQEVNTVFFVAQLLYDALLILLCTFFGWKTRNFPESFNEAKYILFTSLALILIWLGFIPTYIVSPVEYRYIALNFPIILSSTAVLVIFFIPKIYFIYAKSGASKGTEGENNGSDFLTKHIDLTKFSGARTPEERSISALDSTDYSLSNYGVIQDHSPNNGVIQDHSHNNGVIQDHSHNNGVIQDHSVNNRVSQDHSPNNRVSQDHSPNNGVSQDRSPNNGVSQDQSVNNRVSQDHSPNNRVSQDHSPNNGVSQDRSPNNGVSQDQSVNNILIQDRSVNNGVSQDHSVNNRVSQDHSVNNRVIQDHSPNNTGSGDHSPNISRTAYNSTSTTACGHTCKRAQQN